MQKHDTTVCLVQKELTWEHTQRRNRSKMAADSGDTKKSFQQWSTHELRPFGFKGGKASLKRHLVGQSPKTSNPLVRFQWAWSWYWSGLRTSDELDQNLTHRIDVNGEFGVGSLLTKLAIGEIYCCIEDDPLPTYLIIWKLISKCGDVPTSTSENNEANYILP